jgi:hypothetical protein
MAAITASNVTLLRSWEVASKSGARAEISKDLAIVLSAQGATAADIPASALGLSKIYSAVGLAFDDATNVRGAWVGVATDGSEIFPIDAVQATDANRTLRANLTGTLYVRVTGQG